MIKLAKAHNAGNKTKFAVGDVLTGLDFADKSFGIVIASYVAHVLLNRPLRSRC